MRTFPAKLEPLAKPLLIGAAVLLLGAPTAGAVMMTAARPTADQTQPSGRLLPIELVIPPEPEVNPVYPLETFETAPVNEFKAGPQRGRAWRIGFDFEFERQLQEAEPQGEVAYIPYEPPPMEWSREPEHRASYEETVSGWGRALELPEGE